MERMFTVCRGCLDSSIENVVCIYNLLDGNVSHLTSGMPEFFAISSVVVYILHDMPCCVHLVGA
jgi:hypothetical protein